MTANLPRLKRFGPSCAVLLLASAAAAWAAWADPGQDWTPIAQGGAVVELAPDPTMPTTAQDTNTLRLTVKDLGQRAGIVNGKAEEITTQSNQWYDLSFSAATEGNKHFALTVSLEDTGGQQVAARATIPEVGGPWTQFHLALHARRTASHCRPSITMSETGVIWLNAITLVPRDSP